MTNCPNCNGKLEYKSELTTYTYKNKSTDIEQSGKYCTKCKETFLSPKNLEATKIKIADFKSNIAK
ncbi:MAG: YgiT-type zinc finger domain-containing protein [Sulfurimonas sp.]|jgi:YgiT-type zinc finger domain-containing protein